MDGQQWDVTKLIGDPVVDRHDNRLGKVQDIAQLADTLEPLWLVVKTSVFGRRRLVPIASVDVQDDVVHVPFDRDVVLDAPVPAVPVTVAASEARTLSQHYSQAA